MIVNETRMLLQLPVTHFMKQVCCQHCQHVCPEHKDVQDNRQQIKILQAPGSVSVLAPMAVLEMLQCVLTPPPPVNVII